MYYHAYGFSPFVIPNPLTIKPGQPANAKNKRFLAVGRLTPKHKGFDLLIKAFDKFAQTNQDWYLDIVGDGPEKDMLNKMIENRYLSRRVKIHPYTVKFKMERLRTGFGTGYGSWSACNIIGPAIEQRDTGRFRYVLQEWRRGRAGKANGGGHLYGVAAKIGRGYHAGTTFRRESDSRAMENVDRKRWTTKA